MKAAQGLAIRGLIPLGPLQAARSEHTPLAVRAITVRACASDSPFREPKTPKEEQDVEKVVKAGVNVPDSTGQAAREAKDVSFPSA